MWKDWKLNNIDFVRQKTFDGLKGKSRKLKCDFFIPIKNLVIEYNRGQHYRPVPKFGGGETLKYTQEFDKIKADFLLGNKIILEVIRFDEKISDRLNEIFSKSNNFSNSL